MKTYYIQYEDMDGVTCTTSYKYKSIADFLQMCECYDVKLETFTNIRLMKE